MNKGNRCFIHGCQLHAGRFDRCSLISRVKVLSSTPFRVARHMEGEHEVPHATANVIISSTASKAGMKRYELSGNAPRKCGPRGTLSNILNLEQHKLPEKCHGVFMKFHIKHQSN